MEIRIRLALAIVSIILVVSLTVNGFLYSSLSENYSLQKQVTELKDEANALRNQTANLQTQLENYQNRSPYLVTALGAKYTYNVDISGTLQHFLYIKGSVTNMGNGTAYNCALKIVTNSAKDSFTDHYRFNALAPGEHVDIDTHLYHVDLVNWTITPECTNTP